MSFARRLAFAFAVTVAATAQLAAQGAPVAPPSGDQQVVATSSPETPVAASVTSDTAAPAVSLAPTAESGRVGVRSLAPSAPAPFALPRREHASNSVVMMIVGGAVLIVGAVVGGTPGTIIMIGGGVVGILGLVRYLQ